MNRSGKKTLQRRCANKGKGVETAKNAARERTRVKELREGFLKLQSLIPNVPPDTKLSKLDVLILATDYIRHLSLVLRKDDEEEGTSEREDVHSQRLESSGMDIPLEEREAGRGIDVTCDADTFTSHQEKGIRVGRRTRKLEDGGKVDDLQNPIIQKYLHPVKKWPMRRRLYAGLEDQHLPPLKCPDTSMSGSMDEKRFDTSQADSVIFNENESYPLTETTSILAGIETASSLGPSQMDSSSAGCASSPFTSISSPESSPQMTGGNRLSDSSWDSSSYFEVTLDDGTSLLVSTQSLLALDFHEFLPE